MEGSFVVFAKPVAGVKAGEPIRVCPENAGILEQAARQGLEYEKRGSEWNQRTKFRRANNRRRASYAPMFD